MDEMVLLGILASYLGLILLIAADHLVGHAEQWREEGPISFSHLMRIIWSLK